MFFIGNGKNNEIWGGDMSDRIYAFTVTLDGAYKDEDIECVKKAIEMIKGVESVVPLVNNPEVFFAVERARNEIRDKIVDILYPKENQ